MFVCDQPLSPAPHTERAIDAVLPRGHPSRRCLLALCLPCPTPNWEWWNQPLPTPTPLRPAPCAVPCAPAMLPRSTPGARPTAWRQFAQVLTTDTGGSLEAAWLPELVAGSRTAPLPFVRKATFINAAAVSWRGGVGYGVGGGSGLLALGLELPEGLGRVSRRVQHPPPPSLALTSFPLARAETHAAASLGGRRLIHTHTHTAL